ncbi:UNVERIFIED_CONTAM: cytochrome [Sesamum radiatum]|uniref:Cytochrome n=1 Tax=Sesamum radiatum TaxID=300843 RepID=A0AAW2RDK7_SESRA
MFGGTETVASAIEWAMAELMRSPEDLKKVQQELYNVVGPARKVEEPDFDKLTYLRCCLKEVLRLHPPSPSSSTRPPPTPSSPATTSPLNPASSSTPGPSAATRARGKTPTPSDRRGFSARERRISRGATSSSFLSGRAGGRAPGCSSGCMRWKWRWLISSIVLHGSCLMG